MASQVSKPDKRAAERDKSSSEPRTNPQMKVGGIKQVTLSPASDAFPVGHSEAPEPVTHSQAPTEMPPPMDPYLGATIDGRYLVEKQLGEGGMGVVYLCRHTIIDKKVAMKVLRADLARNEEVTERFLNEARSASSIGNAHIIDISDFGRLPDGATYFVMEFLTGTSLAELADARVAIDPVRVGDIAIQLTEGLAAAHAAGIVHRDLKPDNIFLVRQGARPDFVKILDFGIAKATSSTTKLTQAGQVFGTPHYMSPEQAAGTEVDHRSDIYAVGVILYELTTGQLPFDADNFMAILTQHMYREPTPPSDLEGVPPLPSGLEDVILTCLAKEPGKRFQTMSDLGEALHAVFLDLLPAHSLEGRPRTDEFSTPGKFIRKSAASLPGAPPPSSQPATHLRLYSIIGAAAALFAGGLVWALSSSSTPAPAPETVVALAAEPPKAPAPTVEVEKKQVALAVSPLDAHVFDGDTDLGKSPVMLEIGDTPRQLSIRRDGFETQTLTVDGSDPTLSVELVPEKKKPPASAPAPTKTTVSPVTRQLPAKPKAKPKSASDGELVNPWD